MGPGDVKLAAVDVLSVGGGFVAGSGALARYSALHAGSRPSAALAVAVVCGVAVAAAAQYLGLRMLGEPFAGPASTALLITLTASPAAAMAFGAALSGAFPGGTITLLVLAAAAVTALGTPAVTRRAVWRYCATSTRRTGPLAAAAILDLTAAVSSDRPAAPVTPRAASSSGRTGVA